MKKIPLITFLLLFVFTSTCAQKKVKSDFLIYKLDKGYDITEETGSRLTVENETIYFILGYSQYFESEEFINDNFIYADKKFQTETYNDLEFKIYKGHITDNKNVKTNEAQLYLCKQDEFYIAIVKPDDSDNEQIFKSFINNLKVDPKALNWKMNDIEIFSISLPDFYIYIDIDHNLEHVEIGMEGDAFDLNPFFIYIQEDSFDPAYDSIYNGRIDFFVKSNVVHYSVRVENDYGYLFSRKFFEKFKAGIQSYNHQPPGEVIKISQTWALENDISFYEWDWLFTYDGKSVIPWNIRKNYKYFYKYKGLKGIPTSICHVNYEYIIIGDDKGQIMIFDINGDKFDIEPVGHSGKVNHIHNVYDMGIVSCSDDNTLKVWSAGLDNPEPIYTLKGHTEAVTCFDNISEIVVSGSKDNTLRIWDLRAKALSVLNFHSDDITAIKCISKLNTISASKDGEVILWNSADCKKKQSLKLDKGYVTCFNDKFDSDGYFVKFMAGGTSEGEIIVWNKENFKEIVRFKDDHPIKLLRFNKYGLMTVNSENEIKYWDNPEFMNL